MGLRVLSVFKPLHYKNSCKWGNDFICGLVICEVFKLPSWRSLIKSGSLEWLSPLALKHSFMNLGYIALMKSDVSIKAKEGGEEYVEEKKKLKE